MENKYRKFYVDWWKIKKSTVYGVIASVVFVAVVTGGIWWLWNNDSILTNQPTEAGPKDSGKLIYFEGEVRVIRASTRETVLVTKEIFVSAGDTVQTQADGRAKIQMIDGSVISVRPNSTVVIRNSNSLFGGKNVRVALDGGQINVQTQDQTDGENVVEVRESENYVNPETDASFNINEKTNGGEIRISRGSVETKIGDQTTVIKENEFASVSNGKIANRESLVNPPKLVSPGSGEQLLAGSNGSAGVNFRWERSGGIAPSSYNVQIAKSPFFMSDSMILVRDSINSQSISLGSIAPGTYYWRVRASTNSGQVSDWSDPGKFTVIRRSSGNVITAGDWSVEPLGGSIYLVSGKTKPGSTVRVAGREIYASGDGTFTIQISSNSSIVGIEISDDRGNRTRFNLSLTTARATKL